MKILIYSDVHGNKYALESLYETEDYQSADLKVFLGDAFAMCPYPNECIEMIRKSGDVFLLGNHDSYCAFGLPVEEFAFFKEDKKAHQLYMRNKTSPLNIEFLKTIHKEFYFEFDGLKFYFTHYAWETDKLIMDDPDEPNAPTIKTAKLFENIDADYIIFGHNHAPSEFESNGKHFICVGSLGMKKRGNFVVVDIRNGKLKLERKQITFDTAKLKQDMLAEDYPRAEKYTKFFEQ